MASGKPLFRKKRDEVKEGYQSYFQGSHTIFYREIGEDIEILGIPHQNEDIELHVETSQTLMDETQQENREDDQQ